jgi:pimeloyl-ACP methyl ester carboxylesterase
VLVAGVSLFGLGIAAYLSHVQASATALIKSARVIRTTADAEREIAAWRRRSGNEFWVESREGSEKTYKAQIVNGIARLGFVELKEVTVRSRPMQPLAAFIQQSNAVIAHDVAAQLGRITAPTQITFGRADQATSTRFADQMRSNIRGSEALIFEGCAHAPIYEKVEEFNQKTLQFLQRHDGAATTSLAGSA